MGIITIAKKRSTSRNNMKLFHSKKQVKKEDEMFFLPDF